MAAKMQNAITRVKKEKAYPTFEIVFTTGRYFCKLKYSFYYNILYQRSEIYLSYIKKVSCSLKLLYHLNIQFEKICTIFERKYHILFLKLKSDFLRDE